MSGPKLMSITCDPEIIKKNRQLIQKIGKEAYYSQQIDSMNIDIENEKLWVKQYAESIDVRIEFNSDEVSNEISIIHSTTKSIISRLENTKLSKDDLEQKSEIELNKMICDVIRLLPKVKQDLIKELSKHLDKIVQIQNDIRKEEERKRLEEYKKQQKIKEDRINEYKRAEKLAGQRKDALKTRVYRDIVNEDNKNEVNKNVSVDENLSIKELVIIENISNEINSIRNMNILTKHDEKIIKIIQEELVQINKKEDYSVTAREHILNEMVMYFHILEKSIAETISDKVIKNNYREKLLYECDALKNILGVDINLNKSIEELEEIKNNLQEKVAALEEKLYVQKIITEVMEEYGYKDIKTLNLDNQNEVSKIIFDNKENKVCASVGNNAVMFQVVGIGDKEPTQEEKQQQVIQQGAFCTLYPKIKKELEKRKISITYENCAPISAESTVNISVKGYVDDNVQMVRKKIRNTGFGKSNAAQGYYERYGKKQMYLDI